MDDYTLTAIDLNSCPPHIRRKLLSLITLTDCLIEKLEGRIAAKDEVIERMESTIESQHQALMRIANALRSGSEEMRNEFRLTH